MDWGYGKKTKTSVDILSQVQALVPLLFWGTKTELRVVFQHFDYSEKGMNNNTFPRGETAKKNLLKPSDQVMKKNFTNHTILNLYTYIYYIIP